jgi:hypothetical protein
MNSSSERSIILTILAITAVGFLIWVGAIFFIWLLMQVVGLSANFFSMISALSTALAAAAVFGAGFIAIRELAEMTSSRHMEVADRLFAELNSPENIAARTWVFRHLPADPQEGVKSLPPEGHTAVKQVLNSLDRVAFLTQYGWIPDDDIIPWMHPMIAKSWHKLSPYVKYERARRNEPYYYEHAEMLAIRCQKWRQENLAEVDINWVEDAL